MKRIGQNCMSIINLSYKYDDRSINKQRKLSLIIQTFAPRQDAPTKRQGATPCFSPQAGKGYQNRIMLWYPKEREEGIIGKNSKENAKDK
jgi:hypothetical protein